MSYIGALVCVQEPSEVVSSVTYSLLFENRNSVAANEAGR